MIKLYLEKGFVLKGHRKKIYKTEVDLVMESKSTIVLVEVKCVSHKDFLFFRLSPTQKKRLKNVFLRVIHTTSKDVEFHYVVTSLKETLIFDDFLV